MDKYLLLNYSMYNELYVHIWHDLLTIRKIGIENRLFNRN